MSSALAHLNAAFENPFAAHGGDAEEAHRIAVLSSPAVPVEIIRAAGLRPVVVRGGAAPTPLADGILEPAVFPRRCAYLVEAALSGQLRDAACILLPRTSDPDYKAFLYLRELCRLGDLSLRAPVMLFDLLQSDGPEVCAYDTGRTRELFNALTRLADTTATADDVRNVAASTDVARSALRRLLSLRRGTPCVSGAEVLPLIGAFWQLAPKDYAVLANGAADILSRRAPLDGPRVLLAGAPVDGPALHAAIESHGAVVVAEFAAWGFDAAGDDVMPGDDPFAAIAERYRRCVITARTPHRTLWRHMQRLLLGVDAVVVSLPPDDAVFGWAYPALRAWMDEHGVPHACVSGDPWMPLTPEDDEHIAALVAGTQVKAGARHG